MTVILLLMMPVNFVLGFWLAITTGFGPESFRTTREFLFGKKSDEEAPEQPEPSS